MPGPGAKKPKPKPKPKTWPKRKPETRRRILRTRRRAACRALLLGAALASFVVIARAVSCVAAYDRREHRGAAYMAAT